jgi:hypothetical protein
VLDEVVAGVVAMIMHGGLLGYRGMVFSHHAIVIVTNEVVYGVVTVVMVPGQGTRRLGLAVVHEWTTLVLRRFSKYLIVCNCRCGKKGDSASDNKIFHGLSPDNEFRLISKRSVDDCLMEYQLETCQVSFSQKI